MCLGRTFSRIACVLYAFTSFVLGQTRGSVFPPISQLPNQLLSVDTFVIYTDSETWAGTPHPSQALARYREKTGIAAKLVVVGMAPNGFSIADPNDSGMLDVVGFDTAAPNMIGDFIRA